jgi:hypothetical protein
MKHFLFVALTALLATSCSNSETPTATDPGYSLEAFNHLMEFRLVKDTTIFPGHWMAIGGYPDQTYTDDTYKLMASPITVAPDFIADEKSKVILLWDKNHGEGFTSRWGHSDTPSFLPGSLVAQPAGVQLESMQ